MSRACSPEAREKISQARRRQTTESPYVPPDSKDCTACGENKPITEFYSTKRKLKNGEVRYYPRPRCKQCEQERNSAWKDKKKADGTWSEYIREREQRIMADPKRHERRKQRHREYKATQRRRDGQKVVGPWKRYREEGKGGKLDLDPFSEWLAAQVKVLGMEKVMFLTGKDEKQIRRWVDRKDIDGPVQSISLDAADRVFIALDQPDQMAVLYPIDNL